jgi:hypothetical protein
MYCKYIKISSYFSGIYFYVPQFPVFLLSGSGKDQQKPLGVLSALSEISERAVKISYPHPERLPLFHVFP